LVSKEGRDSGKQMIAIIFHFGKQTWHSAFERNTRRRWGRGGKEKGESIYLISSLAKSRAATKKKRGEDKRLIT